MSVSSISRRSRAAGFVAIAIVIALGAVMIASTVSVSISASAGSQNLRFADDPPSAPTGLAATPLSATEIGLSWTNPSGSLTDNHVYIWVADSCPGSANQAIDLGSVYTSYAADGLEPSTTYSFEVTANSSGGESPPSACADATTLPPGTPTGLAAAALSVSEIGLSWTNPSGALTDNNVYVWIGASCSGISNEDIDLGGVYTSYAASDLNAATNYSFEVTASTAGIEGPPTACVTTTTPPPGAPSGLTATAVSPHKIDLRWTNPWQTLISNTVYEYSSGCASLLDTYSIAVATAYNATGLTPSTTYCFTVSASMSGGTGPQSASASATTLKPRPGAPTGLTATASSATTVDLAWTNPTGTLTDNYIYAYDGASCAAPAFFVYDPGAPITSIVWTVLSPATAYSWEVTAVSANGQGPASNCASATTYGPPTGLTASATSFTTVLLAWTNPTGTLTDNYIYAYNGGSCSGSPFFVYDAGGPITSIVWTSLSPATTYSWEVTALTAYDQGPPSNCASATTYGPPTGLTATATSSTTVSLAWTNPTGTLTTNYIYAYNGGSCSGSPFFVYDAGGPITNIVWTSLLPSTTYSWEVTAGTAYGQTPPSNCASATTPALLIPGLDPAGPITTQTAGIGQTSVGGLTTVAPVDLGGAVSAGRAS